MVTLSLSLMTCTFTELDLSHAYKKTLVDEDSEDFLTINRHIKGLFRYNRLPYGVRKESLQQESC